MVYATHSHSLNVQERRLVRVPWRAVGTRRGSFSFINGRKELSTDCNVFPSAAGFDAHGSTAFVCVGAVKGNVSVHSHWITENFTPGSKYSPYCRLILQWYLHHSSTQKHQIILVNYTTLIGLNCVQCFWIFPFRFGETNICSEFRMAEDTTLPRILSYCSALPQALWLVERFVKDKIILYSAVLALLFESHHMNAW